MADLLRTWWFDLLVILAVLGIAWGVYRLRVRQLRQENKKLGALVSQRTTEIERRRLVAESLRELLTILNSDRDLSEMLDHITAEACRLLQADAVAIYRLQMSAGCLTAQSVSGVEANLLAGLVIPLKDGRASLESLRQQPVSMESFAVLSGDPAQQAKVKTVLPRFQSMLSVPLILRNEAYGAIVLYYQSRLELTEEDVSLATIFADQAALAIETAWLREQSKQMAVTAERNRLARDLHDAVTQTLFSASLIADVLPRLWARDPEEAVKRLEELRQLNRGALAEMRTLLLELRPTALLDAEVQELFRHLVDAYAGRARVDVSHEIYAECDLPAEIKVGYYRIAQEVLNNIAKHAHATHVHFELDSRPGAVRLFVEDNGVGFDPQAIPADHLGVGIMRERAESIGAGLEIDSRPGAGTRVTVIWTASDGESDE